MLIKSWIEKENRRPVVLCMSIKPKYADRILAGQKQIEYRRGRPGRALEAVVFYSSSPVRRFVATAKVVHIERLPNHRDSCRKMQVIADLKLKGHPFHPGVTPKEFEEYFDGAEYCNAILLSDIHLFLRRPEYNDVFPVGSPPQSWRWLDHSALKNLQHWTKDNMARVYRQDSFYHLQGE